MNTFYRHTQRGTFAAFCLLLSILICVWLGFTKGWLPVSVVVTVVLIIFFSLFHSLTVEITPEELYVYFSFKVIRSTFPLNSIADARPVRNSWWYGWGIRLTPHGWMYNISGLDAVELTLSDEKKFRIGTDQPEELARQIQQAMARTDR